MIPVGGILDIPMLELLSLWEELVECRYGKNAFGGNVCELYGYRLSGESPSAAASGPESAAAREQGLRRARALHALLLLFRETHGDDILVNDLPVGEWVTEEPLLHRVHVKIICNDNA